MQTLLSKSGLFGTGELDFDSFAEKGYTMCRPNGVWIGVTKEESTVSERLPSIAVEVEMLMKSRLKHMLNWKATESTRHR